MNVKIEASWGNQLASEFEKPYFAQLVKSVHSEYAAGVCYPPGPLIFNAFNQTPFEQVRVVILGQDPYHGPGQAHGLAFSVRDGIQLPPSLQNIFKEIRAETGAPIPESGNLQRWAEQGVLLLNNVLTVEAHLAGSHRGKGWETFTEHIIKYLNEHCDHLVFLLWGRDARSKKAMIDTKKHLVLESAHPSPLSAYNGFFGNNHFVKCNEQLEQWHLTPIIW